ncbi:hypothetical protein M3Y97_00063000 [Aphelenchoides bicaudatus]|nr:hypothetical protein M3Y97_00063000 [Aphelenchoides bicaudatus]
MTSVESLVRNPAPHPAKARELLLDPPDLPLNRHLDRAGSDDEFRRKLNGLRLIRTDSEATNASQKSNTSVHSGPAINEFDGLEFRNPTKHKLIGEIGKTKSASDLLKKKTIIHTFKQQNIMKLPSVDSDIGQDGTRSLPRSNSSSSIADAQLTDRQFQYAMK